LVLEDKGFSFTLASLADNCGQGDPESGGRKPFASQVKEAFAIRRIDAIFFQPLKSL
jgi:hypothetical protein